MTRQQKTELPKNHPLWEAVRHEEAVQEPGVADLRVKQALRLSDEVTDLLETGGDIQLRDREGKLQTVRIKGANEF